MNKFILLISIFLTFKTTAQTYQETITKHRQDYKEAFLKEERSPVKAEDIAYFDFFEIDSTFRVKCTFTKTKSPDIFIIPTVDGKQKEYFKYGILSFAIKGEKEDEFVHFWGLFYYFVSRLLRYTNL